MSSQVNVRLSPESYEKIGRIKELDKRESMGEVVRILVEWILPHLREFDSLGKVTRGAPIIRYSERTDAGEQEQLHTALSIIFDRAPSAVIDEVSRTLTRFAGKYGDEK